MQQPELRTQRKEPSAMQRSLIPFLATVCLSLAAHAASPYPSPSAMVASPDGKTLFVACAGTDQVAVFDVASGKVTRKISVPDSPLGLALTPDGARLYVTCAAPLSSVAIVDTAVGKPIGTIPAGHTAMTPVLSPDGKTL
ncbi:MAG: hypothetical protein FJ388_17050, partial [Verrucomicrobia bacterium]|nr:hypothetical protein [Verrucomicrobiota bacterium]